MIFFVRKEKDGKWHWRLRSSAGADVAHCTAPTKDKVECMEIIDNLKRGVPVADVRLEHVAEEPSSR